MRKQRLIPRWRNWYLTIFYALGYGCIFGLMLAFMGWYLNEGAVLYFSRVFTLVHILLWLFIYAFTEFFELIWKRICK